MKQYEKYVSYFLLTVTIAALLPVMYLGRYNHPVGDDYYYGAETKAVWEETGSLMKTLAAAGRGTAYQYENWQGTYSAMLLMHLPPNIFSEGAYKFVTPVILLVLAGSIFYLLRGVICGLLKGTSGLWLITSSLLTLLSVETVSFQGESFFWYNGSMYYTGYYGLTLLFFGMVARYMAAPGKHHIPPMVLGAFFLAGGNYVSLLPALLILLLLAGGLAWARSPRFKGVGAAAAAMTVGFFINILAPGNQVRRDGMWGLPPWKAILKSLLQGGRYIKAWTGVWLLIALLILTPFLWRSFTGTSFRFRYPLPAVGLMYGLFCSMSCPSFYTMNSTGPARLVAVVYYGFLLFCFASYWYVLGYFYRKTKGRLGCDLVCGAGIVILAAVQILTGSLSQTTTARAAALLRSGEAAAYEQEYQDRMRILRDDTVQEVGFKPYEHQPDMLYVGDFAKDPDHDTNRKAAQYFHKKSIWVEWE